MSTDKLIVLLGGIAVAAWILWYFFVAPRRAAPDAGQQSKPSAGPTHHHDATAR